VTDDDKRRWIDTSAHPWRRCFARVLDSLTNSMVVLFPAGVVVALAEIPVSEDRRDRGFERLVRLWSPLPQASDIVFSSRLLSGRAV
jgi:hypothetical protein